VTITVVHQAKGREWDTVIVPDLQRTVVRPHGRVGLCGLQRLVRFDGKTWQRHHLPSSLLESTEDLFATTGGVGAKVLTAAISGAERAESRRLLYVACTRARKRLVLTATWPDDEALERYAKKGTLRLRRSHGWLEDVVFALQLRPGKGPTLVPGDGVWKEGRDFRWVKPEGEGYGAEPATAALDAEVDPAAVHLAACSVEPVPLVVVNPSSAEGSGPVPAPTLAAPAVAPPVRGESPFAGANEEGSAFHRTVQLWSYRGECSDVLVRKAVREVVGEWRLEERVARIRQLLDAQATCQPALLAELREASMRGELFHELSIGYLRPDGARVEGVIDLLFRDAGGSWHLVDYKTDRATDEDELRKRFEKYHGQVRAYADALAGQLPGGVRVESMRLWLVGAGVVARWG
jgi:ATP-dependent helicase/nuclease subunit A